MQASKAIRRLSLILPCAWIAFAIPARACSLPPAPKTPHAIEEQARHRLNNSDNLAELIGLPSSRARVIRSYKGALRSGDVILIDARTHPCGDGIPAGFQGLFYLTKSDLFEVYPLWRTSPLDRNEFSVVKRLLKRGP